MFGTEKYPRLALVVVGLLALGPTKLLAQEIRPSVDRVSQLVIREGVAIDIHRAAQSTTEARQNTYFHQPALLMIEATEPVVFQGQTYPAQIHSVSVSDEEGSYVLAFLILSSNQTIRDSARDQLLRPSPQGDAEWLATHDIQPSEIGVLGWPITRVRMTLASRNNPELALGTGATTLSEEEKVEGVWEVRVRVPADHLTTVVDGLDDQEVRIAFDYAYSGISELSGVSSRSYQIEATNSVRNELTSQQLEGNAPVFQSERAEVISTVRESTVTVISATDASIVNHLEIDWDETLFSEATLLSDLDASPELLESVNSYLERLVDTVVAETETVDTTTAITEDNTTLRMKVKGAWESGWEVSGEVDLTREWKNRLEREYGVTVTVDETTNIAVASDISVSFLADTWRQGIQQATTYAFISQPSELGMELAGIIEADRTIASDDAIEPISLGLGNDVPMGTGLCYFGKGSEPPAGYAFLDSSFGWPDAPWVPEGRVGLEIGGLGNTLVGITEDEEIVGTVWREGKLEVVGATISGSSFSANGRRVVAASSEQVSYDTAGNYYNNIMQVQGTSGAISFGALDGLLNRSWQSRPHKTRQIPYGSIRHILMSYSFTHGSNPDDPYLFAVGALMLPVAFDAPTSIAGEVIIPNQEIEMSEPNTMPNHLRCRWIVRVR